MFCLCCFVCLVVNSWNNFYVYLFVYLVLNLCLIYYDDCIYVYCDLAISVSIWCLFTLLLMHTYYVCVYIYIYIVHVYIYMHIIYIYAYYIYIYIYYIRSFIEETKILADDATRDLEKAMPALDAAEDALDKLDKKSIAEARAWFPFCTGEMVNCLSLAQELLLAAVQKKKLFVKVPQCSRRDLKDGDAQVEKGKKKKKQQPKLWTASWLHESGGNKGSIAMVCLHGRDMSVKVPQGGVDVLQGKGKTRGSE